MKIVFTGGGTGGHFFPLMAVAEEINEIVEKKNLVKPELFYISNSIYDEMILHKNDIKYKHVFAGKIRRYFSLKNGVDFFKTLVGLPTALNLLFRIYPDVVFSKGGYVSVPVVFAARILRIPVFIHDSDAVPGRANLWASKFAEKIAISYPESIEYFREKDKKKVACVGNPVRREIKIPAKNGAHEYFKFVDNIPTILVMGGSQGAEHINNTLHQALPDLLNRYQVIHQVGKNNFDTYKKLIDIELTNHEHIDRYRVFPFLNNLDLRNAAGCADIVVSRAGSGAIFEIASWGKPSILIPIPESVSRDQRENAYAYARADATEVIEQANFTPHVLVAELERILSNEELLEKMRNGAKEFARPDAAKTLAKELIKIMLKHEL
jgi:UDP-N-acetylglucosamine--N-acetylmuramyl-(pentapeptide) pyrophosphoryl-undecaprenol N-acetylglucosamine transferase